MLGQLGVTAVVDREQMSHRWYSLGDRSDDLGEAAVEYQRDEIGVSVELLQLVLHVSVVDIYRDRANLEGSQHRLDVLGSVVKVQPDHVAGTQARRPEVVSQPIGALVQFSVGQPALFGDHREPARYGIACLFD